MVYSTDTDVFMQWHKIRWKACCEKYSEMLRNAEDPAYEGKPAGVTTALSQYLVWDQVWNSSDDMNFARLHTWIFWWHVRSFERST